MACNFQLAVKDTPEAFIEKVQQALAKAGGQFSGNAEAASFSLSTPVGSIEGSCTVAGDVANVTISEKPFFLSCDKIKEVLEGYL